MHASRNSTPPLQARHDRSGFLSHLAGAVEHEAGAAYHHAARVAATATHLGLNFLALTPYTLYYGSYYEGKAINYLGAHSHSRVLRGATRAFVLQELLAPQVIGLSGDVGIDKIKHALFGTDPVQDEGVYGSPNPLHDYSLPLPRRTPGRRQLEHLWRGNWQ